MSEKLFKYNVEDHHRYVACHIRNETGMKSETTLVTARVTPSGIETLKNNYGISLSHDVRVASIVRTGVYDSDNFERYMIYDAYANNFYLLNVHDNVDAIEEFEETIDGEIIDVEVNTHFFVPVEGIERMTVSIIFDPRIPGGPVVVPDIRRKDTYGAGYIFDMEYHEGLDEVVRTAYPYGPINERLSYDVVNHVERHRLARLAHNNEEKA